MTFAHFLNIRALVAHTHAHELITNEKADPNRRENWATELLKWEWRQINAIDLSFNHCLAIISFTLRPYIPYSNYYYGAARCNIAVHAHAPHAYGAFIAIAVLNFIIIIIKYQLLVHSLSANARARLPLLSMSVHYPAPRRTKCDSRRYAMFKQQRKR